MDDTAAAAAAAAAAGFERKRDCLSVSANVYQDGRVQVKGLHGALH